MPKMPCFHQRNVFSDLFRNCTIRERRRWIVYDQCNIYVSISSFLDEFIQFSKMTRVSHVSHEYDLFLFLRECILKGSYHCLDIESALGKNMDNWQPGSRR